MRKRTIAIFITLSLSITPTLSAEPVCSNNIIKMFIDTDSSSAIDFFDTDGDGIADGALLYVYDGKNAYPIMTLSVEQAESLSLAYLIGPDEIPGTKDDGHGYWIKCTEI
jgi:hypothetical protein